MTWNYRIVRYADGGYGLHEVYYELEGEPTTPTCEPISFTCDEEQGPDGITGALELALVDARTRPVLQLTEMWKEMMQQAIASADPDRPPSLAALRRLYRGMGRMEKIHAPLWFFVEAGDEVTIARAWELGAEDGPASKWREVKK